MVAAEAIVRATVAPYAQFVIVANRIGGHFYAPGQCGIVNNHSLERKFHPDPPGPPGILHGLLTIAGLSRRACTTIPL